VLAPIVITVAQSAGQQALTADLHCYYFPSSPNEFAARAELEQQLKALQRFEGNLGNRRNLWLALEAHEKVQTLYRRYGGYLHPRCARSWEDVACSDEQTLRSWTASQTALPPTISC
jgi:oligoendopeptidase F